MISSIVANDTTSLIAERQSVRRINDALGRFYSTLVYVYLSVTLGKDRHIHTVTLGKDRHIHIRIYAWTLHAQMETENEMETALERRRRLARERERECYTQVG